MTMFYMSVPAKGSFRMISNYERMQEHTVGGDGWRPQNTFFCKIQYLMLITVDVYILCSLLKSSLKLVQNLLHKPPSATWPGVVAGECIPCSNIPKQDLRAVLIAGVCVFCTKLLLHE